MSHSLFFLLLLPSLLPVRRALAGKNVVTSADPFLSHIPKSQRRILKDASSCLYFSVSLSVCSLVTLPQSSVAKKQAGRVDWVTLAIFPQLSWHLCHQAAPRMRRQSKKKSWRNLPPSFPLTGSHNISIKSGGGKSALGVLWFKKICLLLQKTSFKLKQQHNNT